MGVWHLGLSQSRTLGESRTLGISPSRSLRVSESRTVVYVADQLDTKTLFCVLLRFVLKQCFKTKQGFT